MARPPELEGRSCFGLAGSSAHLTNVSIFRKSKVRSQEKSWAQLKRVALGLMQWQVVTDSVSPPQLTICGASPLRLRKSGSTNAGLREVGGCGFKPPESNLRRSKEKWFGKGLSPPLFTTTNKKTETPPSTKAFIFHRWGFDPTEQDGLQCTFQLLARVCWWKGLG